MFKNNFSVISNTKLKVRLNQVLAVTVLIEREWISELKPRSYYLPKVANGI